MNPVRLRLKLTEFIEKDIEQEVVDKIEKLYKINNFKLHLWYREDTLQPGQLKNFIEKYEKQLHFRTKITNTSKILRHDFVWFDIIPVTELKQKNTRFTYTGNIQDGLNQFEETLKFCLKPKSDRPIRKQKRNDNE